MSCFKSEKEIHDFLSKIEFSCTQCSDCCRHEPGAVFLSVKDAEKLSSYLKMEMDEFIQTYCRTMFKNGKTVVSLREKVNFDCIFWDNGCTVYEGRPLQCITYPFWPSNVQSEEAWNEEAKRCKGINRKGTVTAKEKIALYEAEKNARYMDLKLEKDEEDDVRVFFPL